MSEVSTFIWLAFLAIAVLGSIPYLIWMIVLAVKKRWRKLAWVTVVPFGLFAVVLLVTELMDHYAHKSYLRNVYAVEVDRDKPVFNYSSDRSFHGDGYSMMVYKLPDDVRQHFLAANEDSLEPYPIPPNYRDGWRVQKWREAPLDPELDKYLGFALSSYGGGSDAELSGYQLDLQRALRRKGTYYAFFHKDHDSGPANIDLFVIDLENHRIYEINHNT